MRREWNGHEAFQRNPIAAFFADSVFAFLKMSQCFVQLSQALFGAFGQDSASSVIVPGACRVDFVADKKLGFLIPILAQDSDFFAGLVSQRHEHGFEKLARFTISGSFAGRHLDLVSVFQARYRKM